MFPCESLAKKNNIYIYIHTHSGVATEACCLLGAFSVKAPVACGASENITARPPRTWNCCWSATWRYLQHLASEAHWHMHSCTWGHVALFCVLADFCIFQQWPLKESLREILPDYDGFFMFLLVVERATVIHLASVLYILSVRTWRSFPGFGSEYWRWDVFGQCSFLVFVHLLVVLANQSKNLLVQWGSAMEDNDCRPMLLAQSQIL